MKNINKSAIILLAGSAVLSLFAAGKAAAPVVSGNGTTAVSSVTDKDLLNVVNRTVVGRQELVEKAEKLIRQANAEFQKGNFMDACKIYIKAKQEFKKYNSSFFAAKTAFCDRSISRCYNEQAMKDMLEAEKLADINDFDSAIKLCKNAIKYCPERAEQLESRIDFYTKRKAAHNFEKSTSIDTIKPQHASQEYQIELLLEQGREFVSRGEYQKAIRKFNDVLLIDPYNDDANQNLLGCYNRLKKF